MEIHVIALESLLTLKYLWKITLLKPELFMIPNTPTGCLSHWQIIQFFRIHYTYIVKLKGSKILYLNTNPQIPIFQSNRNFPQKAKQLIRWGPNWQ